MNLNKYLFLNVLLLNVSMFGMRMKTAKQLYDSLCQKVEQNIDAVEEESTTLTVNPIDQVSDNVVEEIETMTIINIDKNIFNNTQSVEKFLKIFLTRQQLMHAYYALALDRIYRQCSKDIEPNSWTKLELLVYSFAKNLEDAETNLTEEEMEWLAQFDKYIYSKPTFSYQKIAQALDLRYKLAKLFDNWFKFYGEILTQILSVLNDPIIQKADNKKILAAVTMAKNFVSEKIKLIETANEYSLQKERWNADDDINKIFMSIKSVQEIAQNQFDNLIAIISQSLDLQAILNPIAEHIRSRINYMSENVESFAGLWQSFRKDFNSILMANIFRDNKYNKIINELYSALFNQYKAIGGIVELPESLSLIQCQKSEYEGFAEFIKNQIILVSMISNLSEYLVKYQIAVALYKQQTDYKLNRKKLKKLLNELKSKYNAEDNEDQKKSLASLLDKARNKYEDIGKNYQDKKMQFFALIKSRLGDGLNEIERRLNIYNAPENTTYRNLLNNIITILFPNLSMNFDQREMKYAKEVIESIFGTTIAENKFPNFELMPYLDSIYNFLSGTNFNRSFIELYPLILKNNVQRDFYSE